MAKQRRIWYKYCFKVGNKVVHCDITTVLEWREKELQQKWPGGHIVQVGSRTTEDAAMKWKNEHGYDR